MSFSASSLVMKLSEHSKAMATSFLLSEGTMSTTRQNKRDRSPSIEVSDVAGSSRSPNKSSWKKIRVGISCECACHVGKLKRSPGLW